MSRTIHILALISLLVYYAPARACVLQEWTFGSSCHDNDAAAVIAPDDSGVATRVADGCVPHPHGTHDEQCTCEQPKLAPDRPATTELPPDVGAPLTATPVFLDPLGVGGFRAGPFHPPNRRPLALSLPLLN